MIPPRVLNGIFIFLGWLNRYHTYHTVCFENASRLGKYACPRVLDDQKKAVDDKKMIPGRPHDDQKIFFDNLNF